MTAASITVHEILDDPGFPALKDTVIQATGLAYYVDKDDDLAHQLLDRFAELEETECTAYLGRLEDLELGGAELDRLVERLTVGETFFFRHAEVFDGLRAEVLPEILARNHEQRRIRIWSAGCSTGAELYSVSILLRREYATAFKGWDISMLGTDINRRFLARAAAGAFRDWDFRGSAPDQFKDCFTRRKGEWIIRPEFREGVTFQHHNLVHNCTDFRFGADAGFDLILCRNVLIYFSVDVARRVVQRLGDHLDAHGWLLVGHAEPDVARFSAFRTVNVPGAVLYQKQATPDADPKAAAPAQVNPSEVPLPATRCKSLSPKTEGTAFPPPAGRRARLHSRLDARPRSLDASPLSQVRRLADTGDLEGAVQECRRLINGAQPNPALHLCLALLHNQRGDHAQAEAELRRTIYISPRHALAHYLSGIVKCKQGWTLEATRAFSTVLEILSGQPDGNPVPDAEGMTIGSLRDLARRQYGGLRHK